MQINGRELCMLSQSEFEEKIPHGVVLWAHLQLLNAAYRQNGNDDKDASRFSSLTSGILLLV